jgi:hypothetical protein
MEGYEIIKQFYYKRQLITHVLSIQPTKEAADKEVARLNSFDPFDYHHKYGYNHIKEL